MARERIIAPLNDADVKDRDAKTLTFSVASQLWQELGEKLVGRSPIALAELIKNSYDADAQNVTVIVDPKNSQIAVKDDGHGMSWTEFERYWAVVGSAHKVELSHSRNCNRPLTGSKGVGRISTRVLAHELELATVSEKHPHMEIRAKVDWEKATTVALLTQTQIKCERVTHAKPQPLGTSILVKRLRQEWTRDEIMTLAAEVWKLQPPFMGLRPKGTRCPFAIHFESPDGELTEAFTKASGAILNAYEARITGRIRRGKVEAELEFAREKPKTLDLKIGEGKLKEADFEIRVYKLKGRQRGVLLEDAKEYLEDFRGVHIYDAGFRLPYYGSAEADWLGLTRDHSRRIATSQLLPLQLQIKEGMHHLPTIDHLLGAVTVDTSQESELEITIGRDRLVETEAFTELRDGVRAALDFYAMEKARRRYQQVEQTVRKEPPSKSLNAVLSVVEELKERMPPATAERLRSSLSKVLTDVKKEEQAYTTNLALLGNLATAGISAIAYQHEMSKQVLALEGLLERTAPVLRGEKKLSASEKETLLSDLRSWIDRTRSIGGLFSPYTRAENLKEVNRFLVKETVGHVLRFLAPLMPGISFSQEIEPGLRFPVGALADWLSILQNAIVNAANAMQASKNKRLRFVGKQKRSECSLVILDTGSGVDLEDAERLFKPFERGPELSPERRAAGFGGTGLGLTIVRMIANQRGCSASFVEPSEGFKTAFRLEWRDQN